MIPALLEAALRALLLALLVGGGLALLRVKNVLAQKLAWGLVLLAAVAMPLAMRWPMGLSVALPSLLHRVTQPVPTPRAIAAAPVAEVVQTGVAKSEKQSQKSTSAKFAAKTAPVLRVEETPAASPVVSVADAPVNRLHPAAMGWLLYFGVLAGLMARLIFGLATALRLWRRAEPIALAQLPLCDAGELDGLCLRSSSAVHSPVTVAGGVLLPADFAAWDAEKLRIVLAHEYSHVRQGDFYLQLIAGLHASVFWFSPLGWWLKRKLSDLSETISDRAGMRVAVDGPSYAQVLLEFAALPRPTFTGVAMARTSNLTRRIERLLSEHSFKQAFTGGRVRLFAATLVVPVALVAATAAVRVEAAGQESGSEQQKMVVTATQATNSSAPGQTTVTVQSVKPDEVASKDGTTPKQFQITLSADDAKAQAPAAAGKEKTFFSFTYGQDADGESRAFVTGSNGGPTGSNAIHFYGNWDKERQKELEKARQSAHGNFLWFTSKGKSYIVDDPAVTAQLKKLQEQHAVTLEMTNGFDADRLNALKHIDQAKLDALKNFSFKIDSDKFVLPPDFSKKMEEINRSLGKLQDRLGSKDVDLAELQNKLGDMQAQLGAMQGKLSVARVEMAQKMSDQTQKMSDQMKKISENALRMDNVQVQIPDSKEIDKQVQSIIEQSLKDGKARPVE